MAKFLFLQIARKLAHISCELSVHDDAKMCGFIGGFLILHSELTLLRLRSTSRDLLRSFLDWDPSGSLTHLLKYFTNSYDDIVFLSLFPV